MAMKHIKDILIKVMINFDTNIKMCHNMFIIEVGQDESKDEGHEKHRYPANNNKTK